jgi:hypothetical protein
MALLPFNKHNCHAMLNTLYPPVEVTQPSAKLTIPLLMVQREGFFHYVKAVEARGPMCLQTLMKQGARNGEENGWPAVKRTLTNYLKLANQMIRESQDISSLHIPSDSPLEAPSQLASGEQSQLYNQRSDSGVGFSASPASLDGKHSKHPSTSSSKSTHTVDSDASRITLSSFEFGRGSTLERLARELKKMKPRRIQVDEIIPPQPKSPAREKKTPSVMLTIDRNTNSHINKENLSPPETPPLKSAVTPTRSIRFSTLKKMKSFGTLTELKHRNSSSPSLRNKSPAPPPGGINGDAVIDQLKTLGLLV